MIKGGEFELKKFFNVSTIMIIVGIIVFLIGCIQPSRYEDAKENGYEVDATIVEVITEIENDSESGYTSTSYTVYADYEVDGKEYKHVKIGKYYDTDEYYKGKIVKTVINPDSPGKVMYDGGILCVVGFLVLIGGIVTKIANRKKKRNAVPKSEN